MGTFERDSTEHVDCEATSMGARAATRCSRLTAHVSPSLGVNDNRRGARGQLDGVPVEVQLFKFPPGTPGDVVLLANSRILERSL
jgi:hypothetical protein